MPNLMLPGNPRYQPKDLIPYFGYDRLMMWAVRVELAALDTLIEMGVIPQADSKSLSSGVRANLLRITTSDVDARERAVTKHDIRALVQLMQEQMPEPLQRWVHVPLTSFDVLDTARSLMFWEAHRDVVRPKMKSVIGALTARVIEHRETVQVGRTHGQHALPITAGFWLATILNRLRESDQSMWSAAMRLHGKISGPVGAYNAQHGLGLAHCNGAPFEVAVLAKLGLTAAPISTQILPPEGLASYLFACTLATAALGQFGSDARHLMRTEIGELGEPFEKGQVGSSTMAHKRNPITFENMEGMWRGAKVEFGKVLETLVSEHQRDLVGSSIARDLPIIVVRLVTQLDALLRTGKDDPRPFVSRFRVDRDACRRNLDMLGSRLLAEPLYLALQMAGYQGDAHHLVNHWLIPMVDKKTSLVQALEKVAHKDPDVAAAWHAVPSDTRLLLSEPERYIGLAAEKAMTIALAK